MTQLSMVCICRLEGIIEAENRRLRIFKRLGLVDPTDLTTAIILSLAFNFDVDVSIAADMWFSVGAESPPLHEAVFVSCDRPQDGLVAIWEFFADHFPDRVGAHVYPRDTSLQATLLEDLRVKHGLYQYRRTEHHPDSDELPCADCLDLLNDAVEAQDALDRSWGSPVLDASITKAFAE